MLDREFKELEGKVIKKIVRHNESIIIQFTDNSYAGIYNRAETDKGTLELALKNYNTH